VQGCGPKGVFSKNRRSKVFLRKIAAIRSAKWASRDSVRSALHAVQWRWVSPIAPVAQAGPRERARASAPPLAIIIIFFFFPRHANGQSCQSRQAPRSRPGGPVNFPICGLGIGSLVCPRSARSPLDGDLPLLWPLTLKCLQADGRGVLPGCVGTCPKRSLETTTHRNFAITCAKGDQPCPARQVQRPSARSLTKQGSAYQV